MYPFPENIRPAFFHMFVPKCPPRLIHLVTSFSEIFFCHASLFTTCFQTLAAYGQLLSACRISSTVSWQIPHSGVGRRCLSYSRAPVGNLLKRACYSNMLTCWCPFAFQILCQLVPTRWSSCGSCILYVDETVKPPFDWPCQIIFVWLWCLVAALPSEAKHLLISGIAPRMLRQV